MRSLLVALLLAGPAAAEPTADPKPAPATCTRRANDGHVVCEIKEPIVIAVHPPRPSVIIVPGNPRTIVGRPQSTDRLDGLSRQLR